MAKAKEPEQDIYAERSLLEACRAAERELNANISSHPMRDKCFHHMHRAKIILRAAIHAELKRQTLTQ